MQRLSRFLLVLLRWMTRLGVAFVSPTARLMAAVRAGVRETVALWWPRLVILVVRRRAGLLPLRRGPPALRLALVAALLTIGIPLLGVAFAPPPAPSIAQTTGWVDVATYGAVGNGTTDDTLALRAAIATGKHIRLGWNKIYLTSGTLALNAGQNIYGNQATLKRRNQVATTSTTVITAGVTNSITVADASSLRAGMDVCLYRGAQNALVIHSTLTNPLRITAIAGNVLTFATTSDAGFGAGTTQVALAFYTLETADDCHVYDLKFDGNKVNWPFARWENVNEILAVGSRLLIQGVYINNAAGEGILVENGDNQTIRDCTLTNLVGNGIHFGGVGGDAATGAPGGGAGALVTGCRVVNANLGNGSDIGHQDGCIIFSSFTVDVTITNCYMENGISGIGSLDSADNGDVTLIGNTIRNCTLYGIECNNVSANTAASKVIIQGNRIYASGLADPTVSSGGIVIRALGPSAVCRDYLVAGNYLDSSGILVFAANPLSGDTPPQHIGIKNNHLKSAGIALVSSQWVDVAGNHIDRTGNTANNCISLTGSAVDCQIQTNHCVAGSVGIFLDGTAKSELNIGGNNCYGQNNQGIYISGGANTDIVISGNLTLGLAGSAGSYYGIVTSGSGVSFLGNQCKIGNGVAAIGINGANNTCKGNVCRQTSTIDAIRIFAFTGNVVTDNAVTRVINDGGTGTVLRNNDTIN